jgi:hypothetical protein
MTRADEVAHHVHAVHEGALDHIERPRGLEPRLLGILEDELIDALDERVLQPLLDRELAPLEIIHALRARAALESLGNLEQALGRVRAPREDHILDALAEVGLNLLVDRELARVHDPHG